MVLVIKEFVKKIKGEYKEVGSNKDFTFYKDKDGNYYIKSKK